MFNRHGQRLSIQPKFAKALAQFRARIPLELVGLRSLEAPPQHRARHADYFGLCVRTFSLLGSEGWLENFFRQELGPEFVDDNQVYIAPSIPQDRSAEVWATLQRRNAHVGSPFYEGLIAKEAIS